MKPLLLMTLRISKSILLPMGYGGDKNISFSGKDMEETFWGKAQSAGQK